MGSKGGIFFFLPAAYIKQINKQTPNNLLWCLSGARGRAGSARVSLAAPSRHQHQNLCAGVVRGAEPRTQPELRSGLCWTSVTAAGALLTRGSGFPGVYFDVFLPPLPVISVS